MWLTWGACELPSPEVAFSPLRLRFIFHPPLYLYLVGAIDASCSATSRCGVRAGACSVRRSSPPSASSAGGVRREGRARRPPASPAFYPELVWFVSHYWAETVFTVLLWWGIERTTAADERAARMPPALVAGALFGLAILTRETVLYFVPLAALWLGVAARRRARAARRVPRPPRSPSSCRGRCATGSPSTRSSRCRPPARSTCGRATRG